MPQSNSRDLKQRDINMVAAFITEGKKKHRGAASKTKILSIVAERNKKEKSERLTTSPVSLSEQKDLQSSMDWAPYIAGLGLKDAAAAKTAFDLTWCKIKNITDDLLAASGGGGGEAGPATPDNNGTATSASSKKKKTATGGRKRKAPVSSANVDDDSGSQADDTPVKKKRARRAGIPKPIKAEEKEASGEEDADNFDEA
ncbi:hypothetical protein PG995_006068 [Apiospora arundinis]